MRHEFILLPALLVIVLCYIYFFSARSPSVLVAPPQTISSTDRTRSCYLQNASVDAAHCFFHSNDLTTIRCFPSFIIVGAMKSGTGALMGLLQCNSNILFGKGVKERADQFIASNEMHFFGSNAKQLSSCGRQMQYLQMFSSLPTKQYSVHVSRDHTVSVKDLYLADKSPDYMRKPAALKEMLTMMPSIRLIAILRNPTDRAFSGFQHHCRHRRYFKHKETGKISFDESAAALHNVLSGDDVTRTVLTFPCSASDFHAYVLQQQSLSNDSDFSGLEIAVGYFDDQIMDILFHIKSASSTSKVDFGSYDDLIFLLSANVSAAVTPTARVMVLFQEQLWAAGQDSTVQELLSKVNAFVRAPSSGMTEATDPVDKPASFPLACIKRKIQGEQRRRKKKKKTSFFFSSSAHNATSADGWPRMWPRTKALLDDHYKSHNARLQRIIMKYSNVKDFHLPKSWAI